MHEFLAFERLLAELSAGFVNLPTSRVDDAITDALRRIARLLGVDRANLIGFGARSGESTLTHSWTADGFPLAALRPVSRDYPWAMQRLRAGHAIVVARLAELPAEAAVDEASWRRFGVKANLTVPMTVDGRIEGAIALASFQRERSWPDELVSRLRILAEVFGNALAYKRVHESLQSAIGFERLVSDTLAALLTNDRVENRDRMIEAGLRDMALFLGADRATVLERIGDSAEFRTTHRAPTVEVPAPADQASVAAFPWICAQIVAGSVVRFSTGTDLPPEAAADLHALRELGVRSLVIMPLKIAGRVVRALSFATVHDERDWADHLVHRIALVGRGAREHARARRGAPAGAGGKGAGGARGSRRSSGRVRRLARPRIDAATGRQPRQRRDRDAAARRPEPDLDELRATLADIVATSAAQWTWCRSCVVSCDAARWSVVNSTCGSCSGMSCASSTVKRIRGACGSASRSPTRCRKWWATECNCNRWC
ncbi:MAG: GAF domain-containing protein [Betaproteobacteria bacterium]|nr:GAF domain-containing protein [Betaproteobacteria bacterium]